MIWNHCPTRRVASLVLLAGVWATAAGCGSTVQGRGSALGGPVGQPQSAAGASATVDPNGYVNGSTNGSTNGAAGIKSTSGGLPGGSPTLAGPTAGPGVSSGTPLERTKRVTRPISIGFVVGDFTKAASQVGASAAPDPQIAFKALVAYYNRHGGLGGRLIRPVYYSIDGTSSDYSIASQAACAAMTQDNHVEAVVTLGWVVDTLTKCLLKAGVPQIEASGTEYEDSQGWAEVPNFFEANGVASDRMTRNLLNASLKAGWLTGKDKLGVVMGGCPWTQRLLSKTVTPAARQHGFQVDTFVVACGAGGWSDLGAFVADMQNAAFKMHADGATKIIFLGLEHGGITFFAQAADNQHYYPTYLASSNAAFEVMQSSGLAVPAGQLANVRGLGWIPESDVPNPSITSPGRACASHLRAGGGTAPKSAAEWVNALGSCDAVGLLNAALLNSGGAGGLGPLRSSIEGLGSSYISPFTISGATRFGTSRHDGASLGRLFSYQAGCSCLSYISGPQAMP